ncbi:MAG: heme o synthase [Wenzhouxiangella sp.]
MSRPVAQTTLSAARMPPADVTGLGIIGLCVALFKLRIGFAIALSGLGGLMLASGQWPGVIDMLLFGLAVMIAAGGAGAFNHYFDRDIDAVMGRTNKRPFASGQLAPSGVWPLAFFTQMLAGSVLAGWLFGALSGVFVLAGALTYALIYTAWLKRRSHWNIVIGGAAGSWAVLAGAAAGGEVLSLNIMLLTLVLFLWTPSHFWSLAIALDDDYRRAGVPMLPVTHGRQTAARWNLYNTTALIASSIALAVVVGHPLFWVGVLAGSGWLAWTTLAMVASPTRPLAMRAFKASLVQLGLLLLALFAATAWT